MTQPVGSDEEQGSFARYAAIAATLQHYIEAARAGDGARMRQAFLPEARVRGTYGGRPVDWTLAQFCTAIDGGGPASGLKSRIVHIDFAGAAAMARLEAENWRGTRYTDFFLLVGNGPGWVIADKLFFAHARA